MERDEELPQSNVLMKIFAYFHATSDYWSSSDVGFS